MPCGPKCACLEEPGVECLSVLDPANFGYFRVWCESGTEAQRRAVLGRSKIGLSPAPEPGQKPNPDQFAERHFPLTGDLIAAATARLGIDRLAKYVADQLGGECHCLERQEKLNRLDARLRRWLGIG